MTGARTSIEARILARLEHRGQVDKAGRPYAGHLERVAAAAGRRAASANAAGLIADPDQVVQAAWLHDIIEDTPITAEDLREDGYAEAVIEIVLLLTKPETAVLYAERISKLIASGNLGAILIKLSDNEDNADPARALPGSTKLATRYAASMVRLRAAAEALGYSGS